MHANMKHQSISRWLSQLGLPQYCVVLEQEYDGVEVRLRHSPPVLLNTCRPFQMESREFGRNCETCASLGAATRPTGMPGRLGRLRSTHPSSKRVRPVRHNFIGSAIQRALASFSVNVASLVSMAAAVETAQRKPRSDPWPVVTFILCVITTTSSSVHLSYLAKSTQPGSTHTRRTFDLILFLFLKPRAATFPDTLAEE